MTEISLERREAAGAIPDALRGLHPLLQRLYVSRGIRSLDEVAYSLSGLADVDRLKGLDAAVARLFEALAARQSILVVGDYDADGATSTALAVRCLRRMGAAAVDYLIPNRFDFGYGLTPALVDVVADHPPALIVTVDNGIASHRGIERARTLGIDVIVTDHHLPSSQLPPATAIVNPNQPGDAFPSKALAGVGVVFYLMAALRRRLQAERWFERRGLEPVVMGDFLDLVALGTVADVVPLDANNRILVEQGLRRIRAGKAVPGLLALLNVAGKNHRKTVATDLGFVVGPRLNAAGRLDDMSIGIECLLTDDATAAMTLASELDEFNRQRKAVEAEMRAEAEALCQRIEIDGELEKGLCLHSDNWHQGVVGLVASRFKEKLHRPVIAFAPEESGGVWKGSGRSVPGLHLRDALARINSRHPGLIEKFGGHAMAAGLSVRHENLEAFSRRFAETVREMAPENCFRPVVISDGELNAHELNIHTAHLLRNCGPWGQQFPEPVFDGTFQVIAARKLNGGFARFRLGREGVAPVDAILFEVLEELPPVGGEIHIAYQLSVNDYQGTEGLQLIIKSILRVDG